MGTPKTIVIENVYFKADKLKLDKYGVSAAFNTLL